MKDDILGLVLGHITNSSAARTWQEKRRDKDFFLKPPMPWVGGKTRLLNQILPHLPYLKTYVEPFGGSAAIMLARHEGCLDVYNDKYGAVVEFYRCLRDKDLMDRLVDRLSKTCYSVEEWYYCKEHSDDLVERAARWYYTVMYSFGGLGRAFGRSFDAKNRIGLKLHSALSEFGKIHNRLKSVVIENQPFEDIFKMYDASDTVFYCDPPYLNVSDDNIYDDIFTNKDHAILCELATNAKGFVAITNYRNSLYDAYSWKETIDLNTYVSIGKTQRTKRPEVLYVHYQ